MLVAQLMLGAVQLERFCTEGPPFLIARLCRQRNYVDGYFPGARVVENNQDNRSASGVSGLAQRMYAGVRATIDALGQSDSQQLAAIVASSDDAIISKDLNGIIATWNRGAEKLFGYTADEAIGQSITILFPAELIDDEARILARIRLGERIEHYETVRQRKDGQRVQISLTVSPILDANGQVIGAAKIGRDITARKCAEDAQSALYDFTDRLFRAGSVEDVYEAALTAIIRALGCDRASILLFDWAGIMKFVASRGLSDRYRQAVEGHSPWTPQSKNPAPITVSDIEAAELDGSLKATIRAEKIAALAFIPLSAKGAVIGKFMAYYAGPHDFTEAEINVAVTIARQLGFCLERLNADTQRRNAERAQELLLSESRHRIKNTLATVQAIASQTLRGSDPIKLQAFIGRLHALGEAHDLLTTENWHQASLSDVIASTLKPFAEGQQNRVVVEGLSVGIPSNTAMSLTLCLHELATNASKYGALSNDTGRVRISWDVDHQAQAPRLTLKWQESGGPPVVPSGRRGFGSLLIEATGQAGTCLDFHPEGIRCVLRLPL
jgi:PAS domain S-box-containing protein